MIGMDIIHGTIVLYDRIIEDGFVNVENGLIVGHGPMSDYVSSQRASFNAQGAIVLPGFIDQHIHGAYGHDAMDQSQQALHEIAKGLPKEGTTSFLATTMTQSETAIIDACDHIQRYMREPLGEHEAEILGIHLEGPFISPKHVGAQNPKYVKEPSIELLERFWDASKGTLKLMTYAPEQATLEFTDALDAYHIVPSCGHTDATYGDVVAHMDHGLCNMTHLYNAMLPHHHRSGSPVTAALRYPQLKAELIADGIHIAPEVLEMTVFVKGNDNIIIITDAMRAKGLEDGVYDLGGQTVYKKGNECRLENGVLAGSVGMMNQEAYRIKSLTDCSWNDLAKMTSANSAKQLRVFDRKGSIEVGKDADIVVCTSELEVLLTLCKGQVSYQKEKNTN